MKSNNLSVESRFLAYKTELERNPTNRRKDFIASELHRLSSEIGENEKNIINRLKLKHQQEISDLKNSYEGEIESLNKSLIFRSKEVSEFKEFNKMNKLKAQNTFKKLNARLTPSEYASFSDGLAFIRLFISTTED